MSFDLRLLDELRESMKKRMVTPSEVVEAEKTEESLKINFSNIPPFIDLHKAVLEKKLIDIEKFKLEKRRFELRKEPIPPKLLWEISNQKRIEEHIDLSEPLKNYVTEKVQTIENYKNSADKSLEIMLANQTAALINISNTLGVKTQISLSKSQDSQDDVSESGTAASMPIIRMSSTDSTISQINTQKLLGLDDNLSQSLNEKVQQPIRGFGHESKPALGVLEETELSTTYYV